MKNGFLFVIALLVMAFSVSADIYKWVDANGKVHYSNTPPPEVKGTKVKVDDPAPPTGPATPPATAEYWRQKDEEFRQRRDGKNKIEKDSSDKIALEEAEKRKKACEFFKKDRESVITSQKHLARSPDGGEIIEDPNAEFLNKARRSVAIAELDKEIANNCN
jgi:Domain of unknown function (DUF4124)